ncbi:hypothetical protein TRAPUB_6912 [Trametes pubescens]|uniref:Uncharacterized protein n=1 Tax=Trametes pubescens TaxID=154538 RepID=A0A1M2W6Q4_TRAPU|nr:hypothetical protein TRAPUB_6912 [Trametes pubescens]
MAKTENQLRDRAQVRPKMDHPVLASSHGFREACAPYKGPPEIFQWCIASRAPRFLPSWVAQPISEAESVPQSASRPQRRLHGG